MWKVVIDLPMVIKLLIKMTSNLTLRCLLLASLALQLALPIWAQDAAAPAPAAAPVPAATGVDLEAGKTLFKNQCASCHNKNMKDKLTGPALGGFDQRWAAYPKEDLYGWIRNSQAMIASGHPRAVELWNEWKPTIMTSFTSLTDAEIDNILAYVKDVHANGSNPVAATGSTGGTAMPSEAADNTGLYLLLTGILLLLAVILARILSNLSYMVQVSEGNAAARRKTLFEILTGKGVVAFVLFALVVLGGYTTVNNAIKLGRQQGYQPDQPIRFSHATHSGLHQIDCQYCHDGARRSKQSVIPAANTCMNCHKAIKVGSQYGTAEISKIYASIGYNPNTDQYIPDYNRMSQSKIERIFKKWIADTYVQEKGTLDDEGESLIESQWNGIVTALTDPASGDHKVQGPIEWVRIHNLPDHAYFNHAQHVAVGKVACQTCHGPVEKMEEVYQHSPLSMGWCINCHRKTEVKFSDNPYYHSYEKLHKQLAKGERDKVTVEEIGGLECQKCHY